MVSLKLSGVVIDAQHADGFTHNGYGITFHFEGSADVTISHDMLDRILVTRDHVKKG